MSMRPLPPKQEPSLVAKGIRLALAPALYGVHVSSVLLGWAYANATASMQLPLRLLVTALQLVDALACDLLALLSKEPGLKAQVQSCQETISTLQLTNQAQERQIALLQAELDNIKAERSKTQRKNIELAKQLQRLHQRVSRVSQETQGSSGIGGFTDSPTAAAAGAAGAAGDALKQGAEAYDPALAEAAAGAAAEAGPFAAAGLQHQGVHGSKAQAAAGQRGGEYGHVPAKGWYLHACVIMAALGVRWWLLHQTDPLQRKVMLVIIWPAVWVYGGLLTHTFPNSYTLRATLACTCWALLGYVAHEMVAVSVRGQQQQLV